MAFDPDPLVVSLIAGHTQEGPSYRVVRPAGASSWLLILTMGGAGWIEGETFAPGEAALLSPNHPHAYGAAEGGGGWDLRWAHFHPRPDWGSLLAWQETRPGLRRATLGDEAHAVAAALEAVRTHAARPADPFEERLGLVALESALVRVRRAAADAEDRGDRRVRQAIAFALRHLREPIGPEAMAWAAGISPSRLGRLFAGEVGVSPRAFVERQRLARARSLLAMTDLPVKAVAAEVGFASEFYFANRFRQAVGTSPSAYRAAARASLGSA